MDTVKLLLFFIGRLFGVIKHHPAFCHFSVVAAIINIFPVHGIAVRLRYLPFGATDPPGKHDAIPVKKIGFAVQFPLSRNVPFFPVPVTPLVFYIIILPPAIRRPGCPGI